MTIPASNIVTVNPGVIDSGGSPLSLNGVIFSTSELIPVGSVKSFGSATAVKNFFGAASAEYALVPTYFNGFDNSTIKPGTVFFAPYVSAAREAWVQSGSFAGVTLAQLQAFSGTLIVTVDGVLFTSSSISLATSSSFDDAAVDIAAGFTGAGKPTCEWNAVNSTFSLRSPTTGAASTISAVTGTLATNLKFTSATGAVLSQGADVDTPATALDMLVSQTQNWASFMTMFEPDTDNKTLFAEWTNDQNNRYMYVCWDTDAQAIVNGSTTNFGAIVKAAEYNGTAVVYNTIDLAAFALGTVASIDFSRTNGRITTAFKSQSGFTPSVTDAQIASNLLENGYSFYGSYATANDQFNFFYNGQMAGQWKWIDPYVNQIYLNSQLQLALMTLLTGVGSVPYNQAGYNLIRAAMIDPIEAGLNSGIIRSGVTLSTLQAAQVNQSAGADVAQIIETQGYYLQILDPGAQVRGERGTPVINFWYTDGGAVQKITVASINIL